MLWRSRHRTSTGQQVAEDFRVMKLSDRDEVSVPGLGQLLGLLHGGELDSPGQDLAGVTSQRKRRPSTRRSGQ